MLFVKLWHYVRGYVIIKIEGKHLERLINLIHSNNIFVWDIIKKKPDELHAKIELKDYDAIYSIAERLLCKIEIIKKNGMTLWKWRLKTRKIFAGACVTVFLTIYFISSIVLNIEVSGNDQIDTNEIILELKELGLDTWVRKKNIDIDNVILIYLKDHKEVEYMNIIFNGTKAIVEIVESEEKQQIYDKSIPVDLIAKKSGIIKDMLIINGTANVEIDQEVQEGDLLVKGEYIIQKSEEEKEIVYLHAMATIMAQTNYTREYDIRIYKIIDRENSKINRVFHVGNIVINLFKDDDENYYYDSSEEKTLSIFGKELPIKMNKIKYYEKENCIEKTTEQLEEEVLEKAKQEFKKVGQVEEIKIKSSVMNNNSYKFVVDISVFEEISKEQKINKEE